MYVTSGFIDWDHEKFWWRLKKEEKKKTSQKNVVDGKETMIFNNGLF